MRRNLLSRYVAFAICSVILQGAGLFIQPAFAEAADTRPNIIVILTDNMGWGDMDRKPNGTDPLMPQLQTLAANGVRLDNFHSSAPNCSPSRASLLTGRMPQRHQVSNRGGLFYLPSTEQTISSYLKNSGYDTAVFGKWHLGFERDNMPMQHGFKDWYISLSGVSQGIKGILFREGTSASPESELATYYDMHDFGTYDPRTSELVSLTSDTTPLRVESKNWWSSENLISKSSPTIISIPYMITTQVEKYISDSARKNKPFFIYIPYPSPHLPIDASISDRVDTLADCKSCPTTTNCPSCYSEVYNGLREKCKAAT